MTSSSDGRALQETAVDVPLPTVAGYPPTLKGHHHLAAVWLQPMERESSHDSMVSSTSNLPSSAVQETDAASVLLYQSCNSGKDPRLWNVQEVTGFMYSIGCSNYADAFVKEVCFVCIHSFHCLAGFVRVLEILEFCCVAFQEGLGKRKSWTFVNSSKI